MAKTSLGKAYVQIIPSADGIQGSITKLLGGESKKAGQTSGNSIGSNLVSTLKKVIVGAGVGKFITSSLTEGGKLQQSLGGIETLYKDSYDKMVKYANEAYKTAGLSANEYMETVTSFSASLLQGLSGDTDKAGEVANMALIDMADNANKFGTDMQSIQNAYQGFAKQNYTMLDNLKLGYGGTKTEMQRLLADAQKISGVKYDISNLADVYNAIHVIQTELGVTNTTAEEAKKTFQGSFNAMKASFLNFMGALTTGGDVKTQMTQLVESTTTFVAGNLIPMLVNLASNIPQAIVTGISTALPTLQVGASNLINNLVTFIQEQYPTLVAEGFGMLTSMIDGIITNLPIAMTWILETGLPLLGEIATTLIDNFVVFMEENFPKVIDNGFNMISEFCLGIINNLPSIINSALQTLNTFISILLQNFPLVLQKGIELIGNLVQGIIANLPEIVRGALQALVTFIKSIVDNFPTIVQTGIDMIGELLSGILEELPNLFTEVCSAFGEFDWKQIGIDMIQGVINGVTSMGSSLWNAAKNIAQSAWNAIKSTLEIRSPSKKMYWIGQMIDEGLVQGISDGKDDILSEINSVAKDITNPLSKDLQINSNFSRNSQPAGYNQTVNIYAPTELSPYEVARQTRNATRQMALALGRG